MENSVAVIGGTNILNIKVLEDVEELDVDTDMGTAEVDAGYVNGQKIYLIRRHGRKHDRPPHVINHPANLSALKSMGVKWVLAVSSTGSLKKEIPVPSFVVPEDYVSFFSVPTIYNSQLIHITPEFDPELRNILAKAASDVAKKNGINFVDGGVYVQTTGPRLETKAEVRFMQGMGDLAGMTVASEATVAQELGLKYAALCTTDNYAHGIDAPPDYRKIKESAGEISKLALEAIMKCVEEIMDDNSH